MKFIKKLLTNILIAIAIVLPVVLYTAGLSYIASIVPEVYHHWRWYSGNNSSYLYSRVPR